MFNPANNKKLKWLEHIGLCEGVRNAIWSAVLNVESGKKLVIFGNLIHNRRVQYELSWNGIETVYDMNDIPANARVIIPAHGITKESESKLKTITSDIIDRTCPVVIKLRRLLMSVTRNHDHVVLVGKRNHPEIIGAVSYVDGDRVSIVESYAQAKTLDLPYSNLALISQTTASISVFRSIRELLFNLFGERLSVFETICPTVIKRQQDASEFARKSDIVFVVGDSQSSNTYSLYELAKIENNHSFLISSDELLPFDASIQNVLNKAQSIAILSGTSSPTYIIDETVYRIKRVIDQSKQSHRPVLVIYGPTAIGKTAVAEASAQMMKGEIINVDSMQVYKHLNIGTAKPLLSTKSPPYHMVDIIDPREQFSVARFRLMVSEILKNLNNKGTLAVMAGGSNLYLSSIIDGLFELDEAWDFSIRKMLLKQKNDSGLKALYEKLQEMDPVIAKKIHPNDQKRILRAMEVMLMTNKRMSDLQKEQTYPLPYFYIKIGLLKSPEEIYQRINQRVDDMLDQGLVNEIKKLMEQGYDTTLEQIKAHGYRELIKACKGLLKWDEAIELMKKNTRNYAKRQLSWLRQRSDFHLLNTSLRNPAESAEIIAEIYDKISGYIII